MEQRLSREAKCVLRSAVRCACSMGHSYLGSAHLLIGLFSARQSARLLTRAGLTRMAALHALGSLLGRACPQRFLPQPLAPNVLRILAQAGGQASRTRDGRILAVHLLSAIVQQPDGSALKLLSACGISPQALRDSERASISAPNLEGLHMQNLRLLDQFGQDMAEGADAYAPVIARQREIHALLAILCRKNKNNPALIGEPGVGKTAVVEGFAQLLAQGEVPPQLYGKRLIRLDVASLIAGTKYRGEFEERIRDIVEEVRRNRNVILFVDEMHTLCGAGAAEGAIDASNLLKPALGRGDIQLIGATTLEEYRKYIEKDAALERRFCKILVEEPTQAQAEQMLRAQREQLQRHHCLAISDEAISAAVRLSCRYIPERYLPDKALDLLDQSAAHSRLSGPSAVHDSTLAKQIHSAVGRGEYEKAAQLQNKLEQLGRRNHQPLLRADDVAQTLALQTGIPAAELSRQEQQCMLELENRLSQTVVGQLDAVQAVCDAVRRGQSGVRDENRPLASILLTGPTGVGKTELCKALAEAVFGSRDAMVRLDMSEYMDKISATRLIGAPPGYVGYDNGGELTEKVRRRPYCMVVFDEIEKAHRDINNLLLQLMDEGQLTDSSGRRVSFRNTLIVMTSNLGATNCQTIGFTQQTEAGLFKVLQAHFSPEFLGRIDAIVPFHSLQPDELRQIASLQLARLCQRMQRLGVQLQLHPQTAAAIAAQCAGSKSGARQIRHILRTQLENPLSRRLLTQTRPNRICVTVSGQQLVIE